MLRHITESENMLKIRPGLTDSEPRKAQSVLQKLHSGIGEQGSGSLVCLSLSCVQSTVTLPEKLSVLIESLLIDREALDHLTATKLLNWCRPTRMLYTIHNVAADTRPGDSLLRAVAIVVWGLDDTDTVGLLGRLVHVALTNPATVLRAQLLPRWQCQLDLNNPAGTCGLTPSAFESSLLQSNSQTDDHAWQKVGAVFAASNGTEQFEYSMDSQQHLSLHPIHVFALCNVLRRPIVILPGSRQTQSTSRSVASDDFSGIYLPILHDSAACCRTPVTLIVSPRDPGILLPLLLRAPSSTAGNRLEPEAALPLASWDLVPLVVRCLMADEKPELLLQRYIQISELTFTSITGLNTVNVAKLNVVSPECDMLSAFIAANSSSSREPAENNRTHDWNSGSSMMWKNASPPLSLVATGDDIRAGRTTNTTESQQCLMPGCQFFGRAETDWKCSACFKSELQQQQQQQEEHWRQPRVHFTMETSATSNRQPYTAGKPLSTVEPADLSLLAGRTVFICSVPNCTNPVAADGSELHCVVHRNMWVSSTSSKLEQPPPPLVSAPSSMIQTQYPSLPPPYLMTSYNPSNTVEEGTRCRAVGCALFGRAERSGYCSQHHSSALQTKQTQTSYPSCRNPDCNGTGVGAYNGACVECYIKGGRQSSLSSSSPSTAAIAQTEHVTSQHPATVNIDLAHTTTTTSCIMDFCSNPGSVDCKGLCVECFSTLSQRQLLGSISESGSASTRPRPTLSSSAPAAAAATHDQLNVFDSPPQYKRCIMEGCRSLAVVDNAFCQKCFDKQQQALQALIIH